MNASLFRSGRVALIVLFYGLRKSRSLLLSNTFVPRSTTFKNLEKNWGCLDSNSELLGEESDHNLCAIP